MLRNTAGVHVKWRRWWGPWRSDEGGFALGAYQAIRQSRLPARALPEREARRTGRRTGRMAGRGEGQVDVIAGFRKLYDQDTMPLQKKVDALRLYADHVIAKSEAA